MTLSELERPVATAEEIYRAGGIVVTKLGENIGARIDGVKLSGNLSSETVEAIRYALAVNKAIVFQGQEHLDDEGQWAFAGLLGQQTQSHPTVHSKGKRLLPIEGAANSWHTDVSFVDRIPKASILRAVTLRRTGVRPRGVDDRGLQPASGCVEVVGRQPVGTAHEPVRLRGEAGCRKHRSRSHRRTQAISGRVPPQHLRNNPSVVRVHPQTGERTLLLGHFVKEFVGLKSSETTALLQLLQARVTKLENTFRWAWSPGDVAVWDNRATQHYGIADFGDHTRRLHRITLAGDLPVGVDGTGSRVVQGDASEYSVVETPSRLPGFESA